MRRIIGFAGVVVVIAVAVVALLRDTPAGATTAVATAPTPDRAVPPRDVPSASTAARNDGPPAARAVVDAAKAATTTATTAATPSATTTASNATASTANAKPPIRGLVMRADEAPRSPGASTTMTKEAIQNAIRAVKPKVAACYEKALDQNPALAGKIDIDFTLQGNDDGEGEVTKGEIADSELQSPFFEACVLKEIAGAHFDAPAGGGVVTVRYPFTFSSSSSSQ